MGKHKNLSSYILYINRGVFSKCVNTQDTYCTFLKLLNLLFQICGYSDQHISVTLGESNNKH